MAALVASRPEKINECIYLRLYDMIYFITELVECNKFDYFLVFACGAAQRSRKGRRL